MNPINVRAALDAEAECVKQLKGALAAFGEGYVGAPRLTGGKLAGVNCWWFYVGGGESGNIPRNAPTVSLDMGAGIEGVYADRARAWEMAFTVLGALPIKGGIVQTLFRDGNPTNVYDYFELAERDGKHGLWRVSVPLRIAFNCQKGAGV